MPRPGGLSGSVSAGPAGTGTAVAARCGTRTLLTTSLLSLAIVFGNGQGYIVAGTVQPTVLTEAVAALLAAHS